MRVGVVGGGPGGLFFATLIRRVDPTIEVTVFERNRADDTFGFGVVFSDRALQGIHDADPVLREGLTEYGRHWDAIEVRIKGERIRCGGNGMAAISRRTLLSLLQSQARDAGADLRFSTEVTLDELDHDLVVAADGAGSTILRRLSRNGQRDFGEQIEIATAKFIWFGTDYLFDGLTFVHERGPHGAFAVHGYPISGDVSTFIVETDEETWRRAGLDAFDATQPPGVSDKKSKDYLEKLFAEQIDGRRLLSNNSRWGNFRTRRTKRWHTLGPRPVALLGDAAHTAHFSVGSGTKMAMEDAIALADALAANPGDLSRALAAYEEAAQPSVRRIQDSARPSLAWWEHFGLYHDMFRPWQFAYHFLSRSITDARLARRAPDFVADTHRAWVREHGAEPLETPFTSHGWEAAGRLVKARLTDGAPSHVTGSTGDLPLSPAPGEPHSPWGAVVKAPPSEAGLTKVYDELARLSGPVLVAVYGGTPLTRTLVCERARMVEGLPALLIDPETDRDMALTAVLSGRADLVGVIDAEPDQ